jgi:hypothetical protein
MAPTCSLHVWRSHSGDYEKFCRLGYNAVKGQRISQARNHHRGDTFLWIVGRLLTDYTGIMSQKTHSCSKYLWSIHIYVSYRNWNGPTNLCNPISNSITNHPVNFELKHGYRTYNILVYYQFMEVMHNWTTFHILGYGIPRLEPISFSLTSHDRYLHYYSHPHHSTHIHTLTNTPETESIIMPHSLQM